MGLITKILDKFGYTKKSTTWGKLWETVKEWKLFEGKVTNPYKQVASVYKAIKAIADNVPQAELVFKDWESEKEIYPKELINLFKSPNPLMSDNDFLQAIVGYYALKGEIFIIKTTSIGNTIGTKKLPAELWPFNPSKLEEIKEEKTFPPKLIGWRYGTARFTPEEIIHARDFNPDNVFRGLAPTVPMEKIIDIDWQALIFNKVFFDNNATLGLALSTDKNLTDGQRKRLEEWVKKHYQGASKAFRTIVLEAGLKADVIGSTHKDMDFIEQLRYSREEILGVWRTPKALFNITDDLNYATFMGQMKVFWLYGIMPILRKIEDVFNRYLIQPYDPKIYCEFDLSNVPAFQEDFKNKVETANRLFSLGVPMTDINEKLQMGFDPKRIPDTGYLPFNLIPVGESPQNEPKKIAKKGIDSELVWKQFLNRHIRLEGGFARTLKRYFYEQRKRILDNVNRKDATPIQITIDWSRENDELIRKAMPYLLAGIEKGVEFGKEIIDLELPNMAHEELQQRIKSYLQSRCEKITMINTTIKQQLSEQIEEGLRAGETIAEISDRIRNTYNMAATRSRTIARTETTSSLNGGSALYYDKAGVEYKQWATAGDERVRLDHQIMQEEKVRIEERFSNGLDFPGGDGPAAQTINCRCTILPVLQKE